MTAGYGTERHDLMYNDFVVIGPVADPANIRAAARWRRRCQPFGNQAPIRLARATAEPTAERRLWETSGSARQQHRQLVSGNRNGNGRDIEPDGTGRRLHHMTARPGSPSRTRRTTASFRRRHSPVQPVWRDPRFPERCPSNKYRAAVAFRDWLVSADGQTAIAAFQKNGSQLFFRNAE